MSLPYRPGVGIMLLNKQGQVFVAKRIDMTSEAWQMPQGGIDPGEDPLTTAYRELEEETGVPKSAVELIAQTASDSPLTYDLPEHLIPKLWGGKFRGQEQHWFAMRLFADDSAINIHTAHAEFSEWKWESIENLTGVIVPFKRDMYQKIVAYFMPLIGR